MVIANGHNGLEAVIPTMIGTSATGGKRTLSCKEASRVRRTDAYQVRYLFHRYVWPLFP